MNSPELHDEGSNSRPWYQRNELGPIIAAIGGEVYDRLEEACLNDNFDFYHVSLFPSVADKYSEDGQVSWVRLGAIADEWVVAFDKITDEFVNEQPGVASAVDAFTQSRPATNGLTFRRSLTGILHEGLATGLIMPLQLYGAINQAENDDFILREDLGLPNKRLIDVADLQSRIITPNFVDMLHQLAYAQEGALGLNSSEPRGLMTSNVPVCFKDLSKKTFEYDEDGKVTGFSDEFLDRYHSTIFDVNARVRRGQEQWKKESGGCPVRHASYIKLGSVATEVLKSPNLAEQLVTIEGQSLIERAAISTSRLLDYWLNKN